VLDNLTSILFIRYSVFDSRESWVVSEIKYFIFDIGVFEDKFERVGHSDEGKNLFVWR
jgi:hypothetical protein